MNRANYSQNVHPIVIKQQYEIASVWEFDNKWHTELFSCQPASRCCFSCFCSCCMTYKLAGKLGETAAIGCCPGSLSYLRTKLRTARRIEGSCMGDCCVAAFCAACTETQMANELESHGMWDKPKGTRSKPVRNEHYNKNNDYH